MPGMRRRAEQDFESAGCFVAPRHGAVAQKGLRYTCLH